MAETNYAAELLSQKSAPIEETQNIDYASALMSGQRATSGQAPREAQYPRIDVPEKSISDPSKGASIGTAFMGGIPTEQKSAIRYFAKNRGIPENRYAVIGGDISYLADDGKWYKEVSGALPTMAFNAPDVAEMAPDIAMGVATAPLFAAGIPGAGLAAALTSGTSALSNYARQKIAGLMSGQEVDPLQVGISGGMSLLGEAAPLAKKAVTERRLVRDIAQIDPSMVASLREKSGKYGIPLTAAELTGLSSLMGTQKVLGNIPDSSVKLQNFYKNRELKVQNAVDDYLSSISKVEDAAVAGNRGLQALELQKASLEKAREEAASPIYQKAFDESAPVNTQPVLSGIDNMLKVQPPTGTASKYLKRIKSLLEKPGIDENGDLLKAGVDESGNPIKTMIPEDRLPILHNAKLEIDSMIKEDSFGSLDNTIKSKIIGIQNSLLKEIESGNPAYTEAKNKFAQLSIPINEFDERITGVSLSQMSKDNMKNFANRIFQNASPGTVRYAKEQIVAGGGDEAWNAVTRAYLEEQWNLAKKPIKSQQGDKLDTGNSWQNVLLGDIKQQKAMRIALGNDQFNALRDLSEVLQAAGRVKKLGSDTAFNQLITEELVKNPPITSTATGVARAAGAALQPQNYGKMIADWATKKDAANNAEQLVRLITNSDAIGQLKQLRRMSPTSAKYWAGLGQLLGNYGILEFRD